MTDYITRLRNKAIDLDELPAVADELERLMNQSPLEGWKLVPVEPTREMCRKALMVGARMFQSVESELAETYRVMVSLAPNPSVPSATPTASQG